MAGRASLFGAGGGGKPPPYGDSGLFSVIARRAEGPTRQSALPREKADSHGPFGASE